MNGISLPRGRFTDALVAIIFATAVVQLAPVVYNTVLPYGFAPALFIAGGWSDPLAWGSPLVSQFLLGGILIALFNAVLLLIVGRYVERSIGPLGLYLTFVLGAFAGAAARLALTPGSPLITTGANAGFFALVGAYFMLYGIPAALPIPHNYSRPLQIAVLAAIWAAIQVAFMLTSGAIELSVSLIDPLGGLLAGMVLGRPLLRWRYRNA